MGGMTPLPANLRGRAFDAFCADIADGRGFQRTDAIREILRQSKEREGQLNKRLPVER